MSLHRRSEIQDKRKLCAVDQLCGGQQTRWRSDAKGMDAEEKQSNKIKGGIITFEEAVMGP